MKKTLLKILESKGIDSPVVAISANRATCYIAKKEKFPIDTRDQKLVDF